MPIAAVNLQELLYGENEILESMFLSVFDRAVSASYLIAAVILVRYLLRNSPKNFRFILWIMAGIRLVCPYSIESVLSLVPVRQHIDTSVMHMRRVQIDTGIPALSDTVSQYFQGHELPVTDSANPPLAFIIFVCARIWIAGVIILTGYLLCSWILLKRKLRTAVPHEINMNGNRVKIYYSSQAESPFLFGLFPAKIYMPFSVSSEDIVYVTAHESMHKKRKDYLIKPAGYLILACYWFHPLVWTAYFLMCRDMEFACDEAVIRTLGAESRKEYSKALLSCSVKAKHIAACPTAFGESDIKERIKSVLNYKKPAVLGVISAAVLCAAVTVCFMTQKKEVTDAVAQNEYQNEKANAAAQKGNPNEETNDGTQKGNSNEEINDGAQNGKLDEETNASTQNGSLDEDAVQESAAFEENESEFTDKKELNLYLEETPIQEAAGTAGIGSYFSEPHEEQEFSVMEADLDTDGYPEKIVMSDLGYNGGDGGYKIEVFRLKNGTEEKIPLPDGYAEETGFPFYMEWSGREASLSMPDKTKMYFSQTQILDIYRNKGDAQQIISDMNTEGMYLENASDAVSGFTVVEDAEDHRPVLVLKQYLMGYLGHADCFGYAVSFLKLQEDNTWETEFAYLPE